MKERRHQKRKHLVYFLQVFNRETETFLGNLVDITPEGLMLTSQHPIEPGQQLRLRMDIQFMARDNIHLDFEAVSRWSRNDLDPQFYDTGLKLQNLDENQRSIIEQLIKEMAFTD